jgi:four helix bundle protein
MVPDCPEKVEEVEKWKSGKVSGKCNELTQGVPIVRKIERHTPCSIRDMPPRDLQERTRLFANAVVKFCRTLPKTDEAQEEARQLRRAANSMRRNYRAARRGRSRAEFAAKLGTVYEESDECDLLFPLLPIFYFST